MTLTEIRDNYVRSMQREFWKIDKNMPEMIDKTIAIDMSEAFQDIQRRLNVIQGYTTLSLEDGINVYDLPSNFGKLKKVMFENLELYEISFNELIAKVHAEGKPTHCALYISGNTQQMVVYPRPDQAYTLYVYYYLDLGYYSPTGDTQQNWGNFDDAAFSGMPKLPERYNKAVVDYMVGLYFPEKKMEYEKELNSLRESRIQSLPLKQYSMGGYSTSKGQADMTILSSSATAAASGVSSDAIPDKFYYFTYAYSGNVVTKVDSSGWATELTIEWDAGNGYVEITSADSELSSNNLLITPSITNCTYSNTSSKVYVTPPGNTNFFCKIEQWE